MDCWMKMVVGIMLVVVGMMRLRGWCLTKIKVFVGVNDNVMRCTNTAKNGDEILLGVDAKISCPP